MDSIKFNEIAYNQIAKQYHEKRRNPESSGWNDYLETPAINSLLASIVGGKQVIDIGCGTGLLTKKLLKWNALPTGIDISEEMIKIAIKEVPEVQFDVGSIHEMPYSDNSFDIAASSLVMHYLQDLEIAFKEISRILKPRGLFVFSMHHPFQESFKIDPEQCNGTPVMQPYFHNNEYRWSMCGAEFISYHHTFEAIMTALNKSGFMLRNLIECRPPVESQNVFSGYHFTSKYPTFCVFKAELTEKL